jgi:hypothetical protein
MALTPERSDGMSCMGKLGAMQSIAPGHAFQNACHLNGPLLHQVMLFKMPAI